MIHNYNLRKSKGNFPFSFLLPLPFIHSLIKTEMFKTNIPRAEYPPFFNHRRQLSANKNRCYERQEKAGLGFGWRWIKVRREAVNRWTRASEKEALLHFIYQPIDPASPPHSLPFLLSLEFGRKNEATPSGLSASIDFHSCSSQLVSGSDGIECIASSEQILELFLNILVRKENDSLEFRLELFVKICEN